MNFQVSRASIVSTVSGLHLLAGLWLIVSPVLLRYTHLPAALWNGIVVGAAVLACALPRLTSRTPNLAVSGVNVVLGLWLIVAPFVCGYHAHPVPLVNHLALGMVVAALATWSARATLPSGAPSWREPTPSR